MGRPLPIAALLFLVPINVSSDDLLSCVDPDVVTAFLGSGNQSMRTISDELPQDFPTMQYPADFLFIASSTTATQTSVAFRTDREPSDAESAIEIMFRERGWRSLPQGVTPRMGFQQTRNDLLRHVALCHADGEAMSVTSRREDRGTYVVISKHTSVRNYDCNQQPKRNTDFWSGMTSDLMPELALPANAKSHGSGRGGVIRGSGDDADTHVRITSDLRPEEILAYFSNQLALQGWIFDSAWIGETSEGSTWSLSRDNLPKTVGTLQLVTHSEGDCTIKFSMLAI